jgi:hypothetical protein
MSFVSVEVPFVKRGNRRALSKKQLLEDPYLLDFFERFKHCFEYDVITDYYLFIEPDHG